MMFGYASDETPSLMPLPIHLSHRMAERLASVRKTGVLDYLRPDGKTQVTVGYEDGVARSIDAVVVSTQHQPDVALAQLREEIEEHVIRPLLPHDIDTSRLRVFINPTGRFEIGGPVADAGLTGRKIIVDTYGGMARHGGGAFSGKDPSKVDRSAAYATRWVAKHIVAAGLARRAELQVAYAIGVARPVSLNLETFGTEQADPERILSGVMEVFDLRPGAILDDLDLRRPGYRSTAAYGHIGREGERFTWERTDRVEALRAAVGA
jgi:S-adenosylmethionine synthetase